MYQMDQSSPTEGNALKLLKFYVVSKTHSVTRSEFLSLLTSLEAHNPLSVDWVCDYLGHLYHSRGFPCSVELCKERETIVAAPGMLALMTVSLLNKPSGAFDLLRKELAKSKEVMSLYSADREVLVPLDTQLQMVDLEGISPLIVRILAQFDLTPLYVFEPNGCCYAYDSFGKVYIINNDFLKFLMKSPIKKDDYLDDISYEVAPSLNEFGVMFDKGLIPTQFYEYLERSTKIINHSGFDLEKVTRKVLVRPYIFDLYPETTSSPHRSYSATPRASVETEIRKGETLHDTLLRVVQSELQLASDYVRARVQQTLEYDRDKRGRITPRVVVDVYIDQDEVRPQEVKQRSNKAWRKRRGQGRRAERSGGEELRSTST